MQRLNPLIECRMTGGEREARRYWVAALYRLNYSPQTVSPVAVKSGRGGYGRRTVSYCKDVSA